MIMTVRIRVLTMKGAALSLRRRLQLWMRVPYVQRNAAWTWARTTAWATIVCPDLICRRLPLIMYN